MNLFSYMPSEVERFHQPDISVGAVIVPFWVRQLIERNQLDYIDLFNYDKIRKVLSIEDVSQILCIAENFDHEFLKSFRTCFRGLSSKWSSTMSNENIAEYNNVIVPLASSEKMIDTIVDRLSLGDRDYGDVEEIINDPLLKINGRAISDSLFRIVPISDGTLMVFIEKGIINTLAVRDVCYAMISEYLRALYSVLPLREVSKYTIAFEQYWDML